MSIMSSAYRKMILPSVDRVVTKIAGAMDAPVSLTTQCVLLVAAATTPFVEMCLMKILSKEVELYCACMLKFHVVLKISFLVIT